MNHGLIDNISISLFFYGFQLYLLLLVKPSAILFMSLSTKYKNLSVPYSYSSLRNWKNFFKDVYQSGKLVELLSFAVWESKHRLKIYPNTRYLRFNETLPITLNDLGEPELNHSINHTVERVNHNNWELCVMITQTTMYGVAENQLFVCNLATSTSTLLFTFSEKIKSIFVSAKEDIFVASSGCLFKSSDGGKSFNNVQVLDSEISWFLSNNGFTEIPSTGELLFGEYASIWFNNQWKSLPYLYWSKDGGETWTKLISFFESGVNKHLHIVKYSNLLNCLFLTDGDNYKRLWINTSLTNFHKLNYTRRKSGWNLVNSLHILKGGHTSMVDGEKRVLFGTDYMGGTNFLVSTKDGKKFRSRIIPDPYRKCPIMNMVALQTPHGKQIWASLYIEAGLPSKSLLMYSDDDGETWYRFLEYNGGQHAVEIISQSVVDTNKLFISVLSGGKRSLYQISV